MHFPIAIVRSSGAEALTLEPKIVIGTIHSVKGAQADIVYLFPDLSKAGMMEWNGQRGQLYKDSVVRQMYVGMTRAKEELVICAPVSQFRVNPGLLMAGAKRG